MIKYNGLLFKTQEEVDAYKAEQNVQEEPKQEEKAVAPTTPLTDMVQSKPRKEGRKKMNYRSRKNAEQNALQRQYDRQNAFNAEKYERVIINFNKGISERMDRALQAHGITKSRNMYFKQIILEELARLEEQAGIKNE